MSVGNELGYVTARVETPLANGEVSVGTCFWCSFARRPDDPLIALVTCDHNVNGAVTGRLDLHERDPAGGFPSSFSLSIGDDGDPFHEIWIHHPNASIDLCVAPLDSIAACGNRAGHALFVKAIHVNRIPSDAELRTLGAIEDVIMVGYPDGNWDSVNGLPLVRRGITATDPKVSFEGKPEFITDIASYGGSSGSPVLIFNPNGSMQWPNGSFVPNERLLLLGIHQEGFEIDVDGRMVTAQQAKLRVPQVGVPMNLGNAVIASKLLDFEPLLRALEP